MGLEPRPTDNRTNVALFNIGLGKVLSMTPLGWFGWVVAGAIGTYMFPPKVHPPDKYTHLGVNTALAGIPIPLIYGTQRCNGNYVWRGPLEAVAIEEKTGGGAGGFCGGATQVTGFNYYMRAAIGICEGEVEISRMWTNEKAISVLNSSSITVYEGSSDQTADPTISSYVTNPVPYRSLAYVSFDQYLLGPTDQAPIFNFECHRYPFVADAGDMAFVENASAETILAGGSNPASGLAFKLNSGEVLVINENEMVLRSFDFKPEIEAYDISPYISMYTNKFFFDAEVYEDGDGNTNVWIFYPEAANQMMVANFNLNDITSPVYSVIYGSAKNAGAIFYEGDWAYIFFTQGSTTHTLRRYTINDFSVEQATTNVVMPETSFENVGHNGDFFFVASASWIVVMGYDATIKSQYANGGTPRIFIGCPKGITGLYTLSIEEDNPGPGVYTRRADAEWFTYNDAGILTSVKTYDEGSLWVADSPPEQGPGGDITNYQDCLYRKLTICPDGTWLVSYIGDEVGVKWGSILNIIIDANPSQVFYDALITVKKNDVADYSLPSLQDLNDYCWENRLGVSININAETQLDVFMSTLIQYCHGIIFVNNDGKYEFKVFRNTDVPVSPAITEDDILADTYQKLNVNLKDRVTLPNRLNLGYVDRCAGYVKSTFQADHLLAQEDDGTLIEKAMDFLWLSNPNSASVHSYKLLKLLRYDTEIISLRLMPLHLSRNVGDLLELDLDDSGFENEKIRLLSVGEPDIAQEGSIEITARVEKSFFNTYEFYPIGVTRKPLPSSLYPRAVRPIAVEAPSLRSDDNYMLFLTAINTDAKTIGCRFYVSSSETGNYLFVGEIKNFPYPAYLDGALGGEFRDSKIDVDTTGFPTTIPSFTMNEQLEDSSFSVIGKLVTDSAELGEMEFVNFAEVTGTGNSLRLREAYRGEYYTIPRTHDNADIFLVLGDGYGSGRQYAIVPFSRANRGATLFIKAVPYLISGAKPNLEDVPAYEYKIKGWSRTSPHASDVQLLNPASDGWGSIETTTWWGAPLGLTISYEQIFRVGGIDSIHIDEWPWNDFDEGDGKYVTIYFYDSSFVYKAAYSVYYTDGTTLRYTQVQMTADFGGLQSEFYIKLMPRGGPFKLGLPLDMLPFHKILVI